MDASERIKLPDGVEYMRVTELARDATNRRAVYLIDRLKDQQPYVRMVTADGTEIIREVPWGTAKVLRTAHVLKYQYMKQLDTA